MRVGRHMPTNSNPAKAVAIASSIGCNAIQIFASNPTGWRTTEGGEESCRAFVQAARDYDLSPVVLHAPYLINLASPEEALREKSCTLLSWTLRRGLLLGASYVVLHIGSHKGSGLEAGLERVARSLEKVLAATPPEVMLLLENSVGAGHSLGGEFAHLGTILALLPDSASRVGVCLDTAHLWGAGYDISTRDSALEVLRAFDESVGIARLKVLHLNDTEKPLGSHRDVHARVGEGIIGLEGLQTLLCDPRLAHVAVLLETPIQTDEDGKEDWEHDRQHLAQVMLLIPTSSADQEYHYQ